VSFSRRPDRHPHSYSLKNESNPSMKIVGKRRSATLAVTLIGVFASTLGVFGNGLAAQATPGTPSPHPSPARAPLKPPANAITWSVMPSSAKGLNGRSRFIYNNVKPRNVIHDYVGITNYSSKAVTFHVYASDAFINSSGSFDLLPSSRKPRDVGSWVHLAHTTVTVPGHARVNEPFTLTVPANATPGDHIGGIVAAITKAGTGANRGMKVEERVGARIYLRLGGPLRPILAIGPPHVSYHGSVNPFSGGWTSVSYTVRNTGNVVLGGLQIVKVTSPFGTLATVRPSALPYLLPGDAVTVHTKLPGVFPAGPLKAQIRITPFASPIGLPLKKAPSLVSRNTSLWAIPWLQILLFILLVAAIFALWKWRRRRGEHMKAALVAAEERGRREQAEQGAASVEQPTTEQPTTDQPTTDLATTQSPDRRS
jgi:hypothetical protein